MSNISHQLYQIVSGISNVNQAQHAFISLTLDKGFLSLFKCDLWVTCGVVGFFLSSLCKDHFVEQSNAFKERKADQKTKNLSKKEKNSLLQVGFSEEKSFGLFKSLSFTPQRKTHRPLMRRLFMFCIQIIWLQTLKTDSTRRTTYESEFSSYAYFLCNDERSHSIFVNFFSLAHIKA